MSHLFWHVATISGSGKVKTYLRFLRTGHFIRNCATLLRFWASSSSSFCEFNWGWSYNCRRSIGHDGHFFHSVYSIFCCNIFCLLCPLFPLWHGGQNIWVGVVGVLAHFVMPWQVLKVWYRLTKVLFWQICVQITLYANTWSQPNCWNWHSVGRNLAIHQSSLVKIECG